MTVTFRNWTIHFEKMKWSKTGIHFYTKNGEMESFILEDGKAEHVFDLINSELFSGKTYINLNRLISDRPNT